MIHPLRCLRCAKRLHQVPQCVLTINLTRHSRLITAIGQFTSNYAYLPGLLRVLTWGGLNFNIPPYRPTLAKDVNNPISDHKELIRSRRLSFPTTANSGARRVVLACFGSTMQSQSGPTPDRGSESSKSGSSDAPEDNGSSEGIRPSTGDLLYWAPLPRGLGLPHPPSPAPPPCCCLRLACTPSGKEKITNSVAGQPLKTWDTQFGDIMFFRLNASLKFLKNLTCKYLYLNVYLHAAVVNLRPIFSPSVSGVLSALGWRNDQINQAANSTWTKAYATGLQLQCSGPFNNGTTEYSCDSSWSVLDGRIQDSEPEGHCSVAG